MLIVAQAGDDEALLRRWGLEHGFSHIQVARTARSAWLTWRGQQAREPSNARARCEQWVVVIAGLRTRRAALNLARRMREDEQRRGIAIPTLLIHGLGYLSQLDYEAARAIGFDAVLTRPLRASSLSARVAAWGFVSPSHAAPIAEARRVALSLFEQEVSGDLERLRHALLAQRPDDVARWAHRIKGAALMFGQERLGQLAAEFERHPTGDASTLVRLDSMKAELAVLVSIPS